MLIADIIKDVKNSLDKDDYINDFWSEINKLTTGIILQNNSNANEKNKEATQKTDAKNVKQIYHFQSFLVVLQNQWKIKKLHIR